MPALLFWIRKIVDLTSTCHVVGSTRPLSRTYNQMTKPLLLIICHTCLLYPCSEMWLHKRSRNTTHGHRLYSKVKSRDSFRQISGRPLSPGHQQCTMLYTGMHLNQRRTYNFLKAEHYFFTSLPASFFCRSGTHTRLGISNAVLHTVWHTCSCSWKYVQETYETSHIVSHSQRNTFVTQ